MATWKNLPSSSTNVGQVTVVRASGDATGVTDTGAINAALATGDVWLTGDFTVNNTILIPSNRTVILSNAKISAIANLLAPVLANSQAFVGAGNTGNTNIHIRGIGRAMLDGNGANNPEVLTHLYLSSCLFLCNVDGFSVDSIQGTGSTYVTFVNHAVKNGRFRNIHVDKTTDLGYIHISQGSTNITCDRFTSTGTWTDSVATMAASSAGFYNSPYTATLVAGQLSCSNVAYSNFAVASSVNYVNLINDANGSITNISFDDFHNSSTAVGTNEFWFGRAGYNGMSNPANGSISDIRVSNWTTEAGTPFIQMDTPVSNLHVSGVRYGVTPCRGFLSYSVPAPQPVGLNPQLTGVKISDVSIPVLQTGAFMQMPGGWNVSDIAIQNVGIGRADSALLKNVSDVSGLSISRIRVNNLNAVPFQSTGNENGVVRDFLYSQKGSSVTSLFATPPTFRIEQPFAQLLSNDLTPIPYQGSVINCAPGKDPSGASSTAGGMYQGDGLKWNLISSHNGVFRPNQLYTPLVFHYDASRIMGVADGGAVAKWPDALGNAALSQATTTAQPTFVASDATLNNRPGVRFDGASDFLQSGTLAPISQATPFTIFLVYYWNTLTGSFVLDTASSAQGATGDGITIYRPGNLSVYSGTSNVGNLPVTATTPYILAFTQSGATATIGLNKAAFGSLTSGSSGTARNFLNGLTLGANYNGTASWANITVAEVFAYPKQVSTAEYATVASGLATKYGITLA